MMKKKILFSLFVALAAAVWSPTWAATSYCDEVITATDGITQISVSIYVDGGNYVIKFEDADGRFATESPIDPSVSFSSNDGNKTLSNRITYKDESTIICTIDDAVPDKITTSIILNMPGSKEFTALTNQDIDWDATCKGGGDCNLTEPPTMNSAEVYGQPEATKVVLKVEGEDDNGDPIATFIVKSSSFADKTIKADCPEGEYFLTINNLTPDTEYEVTVYAKDTCKNVSDEGVTLTTFKTAAPKIYAKNNWDGGEWSWKEMTKGNGTFYTLGNVVFGGTGVSINNKNADEGAIWYDLQTMEYVDDSIQANDTVKFIFNLSDSTLSAKLIGRPVPAGPDTLNYLHFVSLKDNGSVRLDTVGTPDAINLQYSKDKQSWTDYSWTETLGAFIALAKNDTVWFRAGGAGKNVVFSKDGTNYYNFVFGTNDSIAAGGNVMSLYDASLEQDTMTNSGFYKLFYSCSALVSAPELPAQTLAKACYFSMFRGCTSLTTAPTLSPLTVAQNCCISMFSGCTSLYVDTLGASCNGVEMSFLETATALNWSMSMFQGCHGNSQCTAQYGIVPGKSYCVSAYIPCQVTVLVNIELMGSVTGAGEYHDGTEVTLTATANEGYQFVNWSNGETANPYSFTAISDSTLTANFEATVPATPDTIWQLDSMRYDDSGGQSLTKYRYYYDENNKDTLRYEDYKNFTYSSSMSIKYQSKYDAQGRLTEQVESYLDETTWILATKEEYTYNAQGLKSQWQYSEYEDGDWTLYQKTFYWYNEQGKLVADSVLDFGDTNKSTYSYDTEGNLTENIYYYWDEGWTPLVKYSYQYDEYGNDTLQMYCTWNDGAWEDNRKHLRSYDASGHLVQEMVYRWKNNDWTKDMELQYTYDANGNKIKEIENNFAEKTKSQCDYYYSQYPAPETYGRKVTQGNYGTICLAKQFTAMEGVDGLYVPSYKTATNLYCVEVELDSVVAGGAYIFQSNADSVTFTLTGEAVAVAVNNDHMKGWLAEDKVLTQADLDGDFADYYLLAGNKITKPLENSTIMKNRAAIDLGNVSDEQSSAPGRRMVAFGRGTATEIVNESENQNENQVVKMMINGQLIIIRDGVKYNAQGAKME